MAYKVITLNLSTSADKKELIAKNNAYRAVMIRTFQRGTDLRLHFGESEGLPVITAGEMFSEECGINDGLYYSCIAQGGVLVGLVVSYS